MKKYFFTFLLLMLVFNNSIFSQNLSGISSQAKYSFKKEYPSALYATWNQLQHENIYAVRFVNKKEAGVAYYDEEGSRIAFARVVSLPGLPARVKAKISSLCKAAEIRAVQELVMYGRTCYFFETEQDGVKKMIRIINSGRLKHWKPEE